MKRLIVVTAMAVSFSAMAAPGSSRSPDAANPVAALVVDAVLKVSPPEVDVAAPPVAEKSRGQKLLERFGLAQKKVMDTTSDVVNSAMSLIGVKYKWGGTNIETGLDCSGFVLAVYKSAMGIALPRTSSEQAHATEKIDRRDLLPGDLVFFNTLRREFSHVGIYLGGEKFIHAPRAGAKVRVEDFNSSYWVKRFNGARRVLASEELMD